MYMLRKHVYYNIILHSPFTSNPWNNTPHLNNYSYGKISDM